MQTYQALCRDRRGRVRKAQLLRCANDDEAIGRAVPFALNRPVELWRGPDLVWRFGEADDGATLPA